MNSFFNKLLASFRIPLGTLTFAAFVIILIESYVNGSMNGLRIFTLIVMGINVIYLVVNKNHPPVIPTLIPPQETKPNGKSEEAGKAFDQQ